MTAVSAPELDLDPDGRPLVVVDLEGTPRDLTAWGMVCAHTAAGAAVAIVCTDHEDPPTAAELRALADTLDDSPEKPGSIVGSRRWEKARADDLTDELARQAGRIVELAEEVAEARRHVARAWEQLNEESSRSDELGDLVTAARGRADQAEASFAVARQQITRLREAHEEQVATIRELRAERDAARQAGRDVARIAVIALAHRGRFRRRIAHLLHQPYRRTR